jgi:peptidoglycan/LPS O-acetylase OafA/YrhL
LVGPLADGLFVPKLARFFVWFWLGYVLSDAARARAARPISSLALLIVPVWMVALFMLLNSNENAQAWALPLTITALPVGFVLAVFLDQSPVSERLAWIGKRTLPIYVRHFIALSLMGKAFERLDLPKGVLATAATAAIAVALALSAKWIANRVGFNWLYDLAMSWRRRLEATLRSFKKHSNSEANAQVLY